MLMRSNTLGNILLINRIDEYFFKFDYFLKEPNLLGLGNRRLNLLY